MDNGFQFFDIILFALIAGFIILRLRSVLGRRDGHEGGYPDPINDRPTSEEDKIVTLRENDTDRPSTDAPATEATADGSTAELGDIKRADSSFDEAQFMDGAKVAFEMIVSAFAMGDRETLGNLLSEDVMSNFERAIDDRQSRNETMEHELVKLDSAELVEASLEGALAKITVKFVSEQVNLTKNADGEVIDGDLNAITRVTDFWTFQRQIRASNPNWTLSATHSLD